MFSGIVAEVGTVHGFARRGDAASLTIEASPACSDMAIGESIAVNGVCLTVVACQSEAFQVTIIPHTATVTAIGRKGIGATVNLECDMIGKYVERVLQARLEGEHETEGGLTLALLRRHGLAE